jgi:hypothetical protein
MAHPALRSPVSGIVTKAGNDRYGTIAIMDANGLSHEILHTNGQHVSIGDPVIEGQLIGTMGNTGTSDQHVHYQLKDQAGNVIDPSAYWDQQGPTDPNPATPALLRDYLEYQRMLDSTVGHAFNIMPDSGPRYGPRLDGRGEAGQQLLARSDARMLVSRPANAPVVLRPTDTVPNELPSASPDPSFGERFGNWGSSAGASAPLSPYQQFAPAPQSARPLGIVTGQPTSDYPFPPPVTEEPAPGMEDWAGLRRKPANWGDRRR